MSTIFVYGDSFGANYEGPFSQPGLCGHWTNLLAEKLNYTEVNNALCGTSMEYSFTKLVDDNFNNCFVPGDVVIFVQPGPGRLHLAHTNSFPNTAAVYANCIDPNFLDDITQYDKAWYMSNYHYLKWYISEYDQELTKLYAETYIPAIDNIALANPKCKFIHLFVNGDPKKKLPINYTPKNVHRSYVSLIELSAREINGYGEGKDVFTEFVMAIEYRSNHLCVPNLHVLANAVYECVAPQFGYDVTLDLSNDKFMSNIISMAKSEEEYMDQVNQGFIYYSEYIKNTLNAKYQKMSAPWTKYFK